jgi:hypothetical protein
MTFPDLENSTKRRPDPSLSSTLADVYRRQDWLDSEIWVLERALKQTPGHPGLAAKLSRARAESDQRINDLMKGGS